MFQQVLISWLLILAVCIDDLAAEQLRLSIVISLFYKKDNVYSQRSPTLTSLTPLCVEFAKALDVLDSNFNVMSSLTI